MAHTNQTTNYGLSQFVGTDIFNPLVDYNGDMEKIDTAIKNVADASVTDTGRITALETQAGSEPLDTTSKILSGAVNELNTATGRLDNRVTTLEGKVTADESTLATAVSNVTTLAGKVSTLETKVGTAVLDTQAQDLSGAVNELKAEIDGSGVDSLANRVTALETQNGNAVLETTAQTLSGAVNELKEAIDDIPSAVVDSAMSDTSEHAVQNKVIKEYVDDRTPFEAQSGTLTAGQTSITLTFAEQSIGSATRVLVFNDLDVPYLTKSTTASTVTLTFEAQASDMVVSVEIHN